MRCDGWEPVFFRPSGEIFREKIRSRVRTKGARIHMRPRAGTEGAEERSGGVCASAAARFACRLWSLEQQARSRGRGKSATRKLYFWVYLEVCSERTALAPVILCQNRPAHNDTSRTLRPSDCVRCRCAWWFWNFCGGEGGSAGVGEVVFWLVLGAGVGSGLGCGVVERLMTMTKGRIWG